MAQQRTQFQRGQYDRPPERKFENEFQPEWIEKGITKECIKYTDDLGEFLKNNDLTTSQIRNVFGELKRIQMKGFKGETTAFLLLKPKMAYAVARDGKRGLKQLTEVFNKAFELVDVSGPNGSAHFKNLMDIMEAILAYHKAYGGR